MLKFIRRFRDPDSWTDSLASASARVDRRFNRAVAPHYARTPGPVKPVPASYTSTPDRPDDKAGQEKVDFVIEMETRVHDEVDAALRLMPRGRDRRINFASLVVAHRYRTRLVVERELRRRWLKEKKSAPDVDLGQRLRREELALGAELQHERHAESFSALTETDLVIKAAQLELIRSMLGEGSDRKELERRRRMIAPEDGGNLGNRQRQRGAEIEL